MNAIVKDRSAAPTLKDPKLFRESAYLDGAWVEADSRARNAVDNPGNGGVVGHVPNTERPAGFAMRRLSSSFAAPA